MNVEKLLWCASMRKIYVASRRSMRQSSTDCSIDIKEERKRQKTKQGELVSKDIFTRLKPSKQPSKSTTRSAHHTNNKQRLGKEDVPGT